MFVPVLPLKGNVNKAIVTKERKSRVGSSLISYLKIDFKRLITDKKITIVILMLLIIAVFDPITFSRYFAKYPNATQTIGNNPFQFWMLLNSAGWGNHLYSTVFWIVIVLFTGLIYHDDKNTSMYMYQITRGSKGAYFISKFISTGLLSFLVVLVTLEINVLMTYTLFPDTVHKTEQYGFNVPLEGSFAYDAYLVNPMNVVQMYTLLNALAIWIFVVFSLCMSVLLNFKNRYIVMVIPVIILYGISYITNAYPSLVIYDIRIILQPLAAAGIEGINWSAVSFVTGGWMLVDLLSDGCSFL